MVNKILGLDIASVFFGSALGILIAEIFLGFENTILTVGAIILFAISFILSLRN